MLRLFSTVYSLKTTKLKTSLYDAVPLLFFFWGLVLVCHVYLSPQLYLELSVFFAVLVNLLVIIRRLIYPHQGEISIVANQAYLDTAKGRYRIDFECFNGWRLLAQLTLDVPTRSQPETWQAYLTLSYWYNRLKQALFEPSYLSIYHTTLSPDDYAYLRSFAAYQCHVNKLETKVK